MQGAENRRGAQTRLIAWIVTGALVVVAAWTLAFVWLMRDLLGLQQNLVRVVVPGSKTLHFAEPGSYTIFLEYQGVVDGRIITAPPTVDVRCTLRAPQTGAEVPITRTEGGTYEYGSTSGRSVAGFKLKQPGDYVLTCERAGGPASNVTITIGRIFGPLFMAVARTIVMIFGSLAAGAVIIVVALVKYVRTARKESAL